MTPSSYSLRAVKVLGERRTTHQNVSRRELLQSAIYDPSSPIFKNGLLVLTVYQDKYTTLKDLCFPKLSVGVYVSQEDLWRAKRTGEGELVGGVSVLHGSSSSLVLSLDSMLFSYAVVSCSGIVFPCAIFSRNSRIL